MHFRERMILSLVPIQFADPKQVTDNIHTPSERWFWAIMIGSTAEIGVEAVDLSRVVEANMDRAWIVHWHGKSSFAKCCNSGSALWR